MLLADALIESVSSPFGKAFIHWFFEIVLSILAVFLILLVLVQRGRGGGIAGALGGMGGNSAFGTKAGDTFTWITYGTAAVWILLAMVTIKTFTDPPQDKARRIAQQEEQEEEPTSDLDIGTLTPDDDSQSTAEDGKVRDEGAFFEKSAGKEAKEVDNEEESTSLPEESEAGEAKAKTSDAADSEDTGDKADTPAEVKSESRDESK